MGVIGMFIVSAVSSVILPTTDYGFDLLLAHQTISFDGDNQVLLGCRSCFHKDEHVLSEKHENDCTTCVTFLPRYSVNNDGEFNETLFKDRETKYTFSFASSICGIPIMDKALELESNSEQCNEKIQQRGKQENSNLESKECDLSDLCCIERVKDLKYSQFDKEIEWAQCIRNNRGCEICIGAGALTLKSCYVLQDIPDPYYQQAKPVNITSFPWHIRDRHCDPMQTTTFYRINNLTIIEGEILNVSHEEGKCLKDDQCCVELRYSEKIDKPNDRPTMSTSQCYDDICKRHLSVATLVANRTVDINYWRSHNIYFQGRDLGGSLCSCLLTYGWSVLIPVSIFYAFGILLCYNDIKSGKASYYEVVFAAFSSYPQWKVIKMWLNYATGNINEEQLTEEKAFLDGSVSSIEPFVESCFQVHISFAIILALDGFFPKNHLGLPQEVFTDYTQAFPIMSFLLSVAASAFGTSKFFLVGPLRLLPQKGLLHGIVSFTFIAALFVNISFVFRMHAIEHIFFSKFQTFSNYATIERFGLLESSINPILSPELRLPLYFLPIIPSMAINIFSLHRSLNFKSLFKLFLTFPQYFIAPCFNPVMFEGITIDDPVQRTHNFKIKVWKVGSIINAIYIMVIPHIALILSDVSRGVINWNFINSKNMTEALAGRVLEKNSSILKHGYGNIMLVVIVSILCLGGLLFLVRKVNNLFVQVSDVLATCSHDTTNWKILWTPEKSLSHSETNDLEEQHELEPLSNVTHTENVEKHASSQDTPDKQEDVIIQETEILNAQAQQET